MNVEFGLSIRPAPPEEDLALVVEAERLGFDTALFGDSQNAFATPFVRMGATAGLTDRIRFASCGVPAHTRHPAMAAGEALTAHSYSGGRVVLGLARGDSALGMIGREVPGPIDQFARFATRVRGYLRGDTVDLDGKPSRITWIPAHLPPVPVDIAVTGPNAITMAAGIADRVSFAVGSDPERIDWALQLARAGVRAAGRDPDEVSFGAYVNVAVAADDGAAVAAAAEKMCGPIAYSAHFSAMKETRVADHPPALRRVTERLRRAFVHRDGTPAQCVDPEFARWWGAVGTVAEVVDKVGTLLDKGIRHVYLLNGTTADRAFTQASLQRLATEVVPALRTRADPHAAPTDQ